MAQETAIARRLLAIRNAEAAAALKSSRAAGAAFDAKLRAQERATAAYERNLRKQVAADEAAEHRKTQIAQRETEKREKAEARATRRMEAERLRTMSRIAGRVGGALYSVGADLSRRAFDTVGSAVRDSLALGDLANQISIKGRLPGQEYADPRELQRQFQNAAIANPGTRAADIAAGVQEYLSKTGDLKTGMSLTETFAKAQSATGTDAKALAATTAALSTNFNFQGLKDFQQALAVLTYQGKQGAFELEDAAAQFTRLSAAANAFNIGKGGQAVATLGGLSQIAFRGTGNARAASTALQNVFAGLTTKAPRDLVYTKEGGKRDIKDILVDVISKTGGNDLAAKEAGLAKLFGKQGIRAINPLYAAFSDTFRATKGTDAEKTAAGMAKLRQVLDENIQTVANWSDVESDAARAQDSNSSRVTAAMELLQAKVATDLVPALIPLIGKLPVLIDALDPVIDIFTDLVGVIGDLIQFLEEADIIKRSPGSEQRKAQRELDKLNSDMNGRIGPPSEEELRRKAALEYQVRALGDVEHQPKEGDSGAGKRVIKGAAVGAAVGGAIGGKPGAAVGATLGVVSAKAAEEQAKDAANQRGQGYIETASGAIISVGSMRDTAAHAGGGKAPEIDTTKAQAGIGAFTSALLAAAKSISAAGQPTAGNL
jgi:hypothetical protein